MAGGFGCWWRSPPSAKPLADRGAEVVVGDVADEDAVATAVDGVTTVYHLAGRLLSPGVAVAEYRRTHVDGTRLLLARCREESGFERFVHCSTTGVLGITGRRPADEDSPFRPTDVLLRPPRRRRSWRCAKRGETACPQ